MGHFNKRGVHIAWSNIMHGRMSNISEKVFLGMEEEF